MNDPRPSDPELLTRTERRVDPDGVLHIRDSLRADTRTDFHTVLTHAVRRGGLRLKIIGLSVLTILATVGMLSWFFVDLMERSMTEKAFEVVRTSLDRIADAAGTALLERAAETRIGLDEMLREMRDAHGVQGLLDVTVFATERQEGELRLTWFAGFAEAATGMREPPVLERVAAVGAMAEERFVFERAGQPVDAYRFFKPIRFEYRGKEHLLGAVVLAYDRAAILGPVHEVVRLAALATGAVLLVSTLLAYGLGRRLSRPIITVAQAAVEVARGNLNVELSISTNDELELLGQEFNRMVQGLREKEMMQKYVSGSTIAMIRTGGDAEVRLGGDHKSLTFLFSDIRGFTALSEHLPPEEVVGIVNFYLDLQARIIRRHGGDIDKFIGDAVMAAFFGRQAIERALAAAVEIQQTIRARNVERAAAGERTVEVGIGINYGRVLVGNIGSYDRMDFTSIGAAVNLASRLCHEAPPGRILVSREVYDLTPHDYPCEEMGALEVRGFSKPIEVVAIAP